MAVHHGDGPLFAEYGFAAGFDTRAGSLATADAQDRNLVVARRQRLHVRRGEAGYVGAVGADDGGCSQCARWAGGGSALGTDSD